MKLKVGEEAVVYERGHKHCGVVIKAEEENGAQNYWVKDKDEKIEHGYISGPEGGDDDVMYSRKEWEDLGETFE